MKSTTAPTKLANGTNEPQVKSSSAKTLAGSKTKDKIIQTSLELFNNASVSAVTTNHIAKELNISPGNLYFHFRNKEEIIRQIFKNMSKETFLLWRGKKGQKTLHPLELIEKNYELFWKYRFFHREMYFLCEQDSQLSRMWTTHLAKLKRMMIIVYKRWWKLGWMLPIVSKSETDFISTVILATASNFIQFFESSDRSSAKSQLLTGKKYVCWILMPWTHGEIRRDFENFVHENKTT
jgi:AcrR family transcriptional regulator